MAAFITNRPARLADTPVITSGSAYASGQSIGGLRELARAQVGPLHLIAQSLIIADASAQNLPIDVFLFYDQPSGGSTITDKSAISLAAADKLLCIGVVSVVDWKAEGIGQALNLALPVEIDNGKSLWSAMVARGTPTFGSTSALTLQLDLLKGRL